MENKQSVWWRVMQGALLIELVGIIWAVWINVRQLITLFGKNITENGVFGLQLSIVLVLVLAALWVFFSLKAAIFRKDWVRSSNLTIQILVAATATGILQGIMSTKAVGLTLLVCAIAGVAASLMIASSQRQMSNKKKLNQ